MGTWIDGRPVKSALTTPEAPDLHALFAVMRERGVEVCAMEVSSHAMVMGRVDGVVFDLAVFTNFGRDHLDFHPTVEEYFAAKAELFTPARATPRPRQRRRRRGRTAGRRTRRSRRGRSRVGAPRPTGGATTSRPPPAGPRSRWTARTDSTCTGAVGLAGAFNVANAVTAIAAIAEVGLDAEAAAAGDRRRDARCRAGWSAIDAGQGFTVIVDYAHKPDAVTAALDALRPVTPGRLIIVVGAGGDRDQGKRPLMGEIAARLADVLVVTDDNPRSEDPAAIRAEIVAGADGAATPRSSRSATGGRRSEHALREARPGDTVLIAGKGHETGQEVGGTVLPFDDRAVALARSLARAHGRRADDPDDPGGDRRRRRR